MFTPESIADEDAFPLSGLAFSLVVIYLGPAEEGPQGTEKLRPHPCDTHLCRNTAIGSRESFVAPSKQRHAREVESMLAPFDEMHRTDGDVRRIDQVGKLRHMFKQQPQTISPSALES